MLQPPPRGICGAPRRATPSSGLGLPPWPVVTAAISNAEQRSTVPAPAPNFPASTVHDTVGVNGPNCSTSAARSVDDGGLPTGSSCRYPTRSRDGTSVSCSVSKAGTARMAPAVTFTLGATPTSASNSTG